MRILSVTLFHIRYTYEFHDLKRFLFHFLLRNIRSSKENFLDLRADSHGRVQRCHRILEYESYILPAKLSKLFLAHLKHIIAVEQDLSAFEESRRFRVQSHNALRRYTLTASGLSYNTKNLSFSYLKAYIPYSFHFSSVCVKGVDNIFHFQNIYILCHFRFLLFCSTKFRIYCIA